MNEDLLTPLIGRLMDRAEAAAMEAEAGAGGAEVVRLLSEFHGARDLV